MALKKYSERLAAWGRSYADRGSRERRYFINSNARKRWLNIYNIC